MICEESMISLKNQVSASLIASSYDSNLVIQISVIRIEK